MRRRPLLLVAISLLTGTPFALAQTAKSKPIPKIKLSRPWELRRLQPRERLEYYSELQSIMVLIERNSTEGNPEKRNALISVAFPEAKATNQPGELCAIGGYVEKWKRCEDGRICCSSPDGVTQPDVPAEAKFACGEHGGSCNSMIYLYGNDQGSRACEDLTELAMNCQSAFRERYKNTSQGRGQLDADMDKFSRSADGVSHDGNHQELARKFNQVIENLSLRSQDEARLRKHISNVNYLRDKSAGDLPPENEVATPARASTAQVSSGFSSGALPNNSPTSVTSSKPAIAASTSPDKDSKIQKSAAPKAEAPAPELSPKNGSSPLLGSELSCVRDGLKKLGHNPSELYLSLLGAGVQASGTPYKPNQDTSRAQLRKRVISMVQAYGFCDEKSYSAKDLKSEDRKRVRRWLTADNGQAKPHRGLEYFRNIEGQSAKSSTARTLSEIYGIEGTGKESPEKKIEKILATFTPNEEEWNRADIHQRHRRLRDQNLPATKSRLGKCLSDIAEKKSKIEAFKIEALRLPPIGRDGKRPPYDTLERQQVTEASRLACETMTKSCGLTDQSLCAIQAPKTSGTNAPGTSENRLSH